MGGLLDIIFFFPGGFSQWRVGDNVNKSHRLKSPSSSVLHNVTLPFLSSPMNIVSRCSINTYWGRWVSGLPCCFILLDLGATVLPQMLSPSLALPCLGPAFLQLNWGWLPFPKECGWKTCEGWENRENVQMCKIVSLWSPDSSQMVSRSARLIFAWTLLDSHGWLSLSPPKILVDLLDFPSRKAVY